MREVWINGVRYVREDIPQPIYKVAAYFNQNKPLYYGPYHSLADAIWQVRCCVENGAFSVVLNIEGR